MTDTTTTQVPAHYTDEKLQADLAEYEGTIFRGFYRRALYMLQIPAELRVQASLDAGELSNCVPGYTYADALSVVVQRPEFRAAAIAAGIA